MTLMTSEVIQMLPPFSLGTLALRTMLRGPHEESGPSSTAQLSCQHRLVRQLNGSSAQTGMVGRREAAPAKRCPNCRFRSEVNEAVVIRH